MKCLLGVLLHVNTPIFIALNCYTTYTILSQETTSTIWDQILESLHSHVHPSKDPFTATTCKLIIIKAHWINSEKVGLYYFRHQVCMVVNALFPQIIQCLVSLKPNNTHTHTIMYWCLGWLRPRAFRGLEMGHLWLYKQQLLAGYLHKPRKNARWLVAGTLH